MKRPFMLLVAVLGAAVLLSACGSNGGPAAARVGSSEVSRAQLDDELEALSGNEAWLTALAPDLAVQRLSYPGGGVSTALSAAWLTTLVKQIVIDDIFEKKNLTITAENRKEAEASAEQLFTAGETNTFNTLPRWFRDDFLERQARFVAVSESLPDRAPPTDAQIEATLEQVKGTYCPSGNAILHILADTKDQADAIAASLARGASFDDLVKESGDEGTAEAGGFLTCTGATNYPQLPEAFRTAIEQLPVGGTSAPVQSEIGWHVLKIVPWDATSLRALGTSLWESQRTAPVIDLVNNRLVKARACSEAPPPKERRKHPERPCPKIWIDPRYGRITPSPVRIEPPKAPAPVSKPADTPTATVGSPGQ